MTEETRLKLQAWVDGELPAADARAVARCLARDAEAAALVEELRALRQWLAAGEPTRVVPESREFYWAQIARQLPTRPAGSPARPGWVEGWRPAWAWWATAAALLVGLALWWAPGRPPTQNASARPPEIETPSTELGTFTFRSEAEQMTVVWVNSY